VTIAEVLKARGYVTRIIGKWHLGDQRPFIPTRQGFDSPIRVRSSQGADPGVARTIYDIRGQALNQHFRTVCSLLIIGVATSSHLLASDGEEHVSVVQVPEAGSSVLLLGAAVVGLLLVVRRFKK